MTTPINDIKKTQASTDTIDVRLTVDYTNISVKLKFYYCTHRKRICTPLYLT